MQKPQLAIITGRPGSGKSTLAQALAGSLRVPLASRDHLKEGYVRTHGFEAVNHEEAARQVNTLFFSTIEAMLQAQVSLIAEAAFQHKLWAPRVLPLNAMADVRVIVCEVPFEVAAARWRAREAADPLWSKYHPWNQNWEPAEYDPPQLEAPTLVVDTSKPVEEFLNKVLGFLDSEEPRPD